jgi:antiviral helicase SLH1
MDHSAVFHVADTVGCQDGTSTSQGKVNVLLQAYISRWLVDDFALVSDTAYVAQNSGRIIRALLEIGISRKWANVTVVLIAMSIAIEKRLWPFDHPLKQFSLKAEIIYGLDNYADELSVSDLASLSAVQLGYLVRLNERHGAAILTSAQQFPAVKLNYDLRPLGSDVLKIAVQIHRAFEWNSKVHGTAEPFWIWVEDHNGSYILQLARLMFHATTKVLNTEFMISIPNSQPPPSVTIRFISDSWIEAEDELYIPLDSLIMPISSNCHSTILDLPFLPLSVLGHPAVENLFTNRVHDFNAIQTQSIWSMVQTQSHSLLCAPTGCGKSLLAQIVIG